MRLAQNVYWTGTVLSFADDGEGSELGPGEAYYAVSVQGPGEEWLDEPASAYEQREDYPEGVRVFVASSTGWPSDIRTIGDLPEETQLEYAGTPSEDRFSVLKPSVLHWCSTQIITQVRTIGPDEIFSLHKAAVAGLLAADDGRPHRYEEEFKVLEELAWGGTARGWLQPRGIKVKYADVIEQIRCTACAGTGRHNGAESEKRVCLRCGGCGIEEEVVNLLVRQSTSDGRTGRGPAVVVPLLPFTKRYQIQDPPVWPPPLPGSSSWS